DDPAKLRQLAPASVMTFGRAVSGDDYAVVAAQAPGVDAASVAWSWDAVAQRPAVTVYVRGGDGALASATAALSAEMAPDLPLDVQLAQPRRCSLAVNVQIASNFDPGKVTSAISDALAGASGLFSPAGLRVGETLYRSALEATILSVPGALAVPRLRLRVRRPARRPLRSAGPRFVPGAGSWFDLPAQNIHISQVSSDQ
ncbi:MAG TPA: hypothetical protein VFN61_05020, partial [Acidimicrobiales bacterium]|nr:hypothetical protein [Acidimicrobiales bacterium]